jgi:hypothetical protein
MYEEGLDHLNTLETNGTGFDFSLLSMHKGIFYRRLKRYPEAILCFLASKPNDSYKSTWSIEFAGCYENVGSFDLAYRLYIDLVNTIGSDSLEFAYDRALFCAQKFSNKVYREIIEDQKYLNSICNPFSIKTYLRGVLRLGIPQAHDYVINLINSKIPNSDDEEFLELIYLCFRSGKFSTEEGSSLIKNYKNIVYFSKLLSYGAKYLEDPEFERKLESVNFVSTEHSMMQLTDAINNKKHFSLIRLGDGEGNFLGKIVSSDDSIANTQYNRIMKNWFGDLPAGLSVDIDLHSLIIEAISTADQLGFPNISRIVYESTNDYRGFQGVYNASKYCVNSTHHAYTPVSPVLHYSLLNSDIFIDAVRKASAFHTITCFDKFGDVMRNKLGFKVGRDFLIPGEKGVPSLPDKYKQGAHFPDVFIKVLDEISNLNAGDVLFIGAGILGKIYCSRAKKRGLIAVDIGSLSDLIMGLNTRPGFLKKEFRDSHPWLERFDVL